MTYFGSAAVPADNGANAGPTVTITPPGSMVAGDLVTVLVQARESLTSFDVTTTGGQDWVLNFTTDTTNLSVLMLHCIFNGTWDTNPIFSNLSGGGAAMSGVMHVFRPTTGYNFQLSGFDTGVVYDVTYSAPGSPFDVTVPADTSTKDRIVAVAWLTSTDDNTWALQSGTWTNAGTAQYRNTTGQDMSSSTAYKFFTSAGAVDAVTNRQATLGGDLGTAMEMGFYELASATGRSFGAIID